MWKPQRLVNLWDPTSRNFKSEQKRWRAWRLAEKEGVAIRKVVKILSGQM
jgi:hypothetical protein